MSFLYEVFVLNVWPLRLKKKNCACSLCHAKCIFFTTFANLYLLFNVIFTVSGPEPPNSVTADFTSHNGGFTDPRFSRMSKISVDSFESSSTSSGECYENVQNGQSQFYGY